MGAASPRVDNKSTVIAAPPPTDAKAVSRLLDHCAGAASLGEARPGGRERLEATLGCELTQRLVGALAGNHALPARR
jgi:hypothetical protein